MISETSIAEQALPAEALTEGVSKRAPGILAPPRHVARQRGWLVRRALLAADLAGLTVALLVPALIFGVGGSGSNRLGDAGEYALLISALPAWVVAAKLYGLYDRDEERTDHSTVDDISGVLQLVTLISWLLVVLLYVMPVAQPGLPKILTFWAVAVVAIPLARACGRAYCRRRPDYLENTVIVGAAQVGQLIARKLLQHPEYGINLLGFIDATPRPRRPDLQDLTHLGSLDQLTSIVKTLGVERVIFAFPEEPHEKLLERVRDVRELNIQVDIVPRLFELMGPQIAIHTVEGLPLMGLPPTRIPRSSMALKRVLDVVGALVGLALASPLFVYAAWRIRRESSGPVFFRQHRLGMEMREFSMLKFRTMHVDVDDTPHREYIKQTMSSEALLDDTGAYKLERSDAVTPFGRWLRKTSLDEVPQLINVLRGEMSLVGPRPCLAYETESFLPHHFERFHVPQGITGLWQVTARARSTFGEALEMDVMYVRRWSLGLDLALLLKTPFEVLRARSTA